MADKFSKKIITSIQSVILSFVLKLSQCCTDFSWLECRPLLLYTSEFVYDDKMYKYSRHATYIKSIHAGRIICTAA